MKKLKIFLDTSVYSAIFDERDPHRQKLTQDFWKTIVDYELDYSELNIEEIDAVPNAMLKRKMKKLLKTGRKVEINQEAKRS